MTPVWWMAAVGAAAWLAATALARESINPEAWLGMAAPLAAAAATWIVAARTFARAPGRLTQVMVAGFGVKMVFFGAYVVLALRGLALRPVPFVVSFAGFFVALHVIEALFLRRLFLDGARVAPRGAEGGAGR